MRPAPAVRLVAVLALLVLGGAWLRLRHLGALGLTADEGNQALAVQGIMAHGVPRVDSGRLYIRGLPFLYAEAAAAAVVGVNEFALRLPAVVFGLLAILLTYWAGLPLVGRRAALLGAAVIALSSWEIEMSRYARFYTPFQCAYVAAVGCYARAAFGGGWRWLAAFAAVTAVAFSLHELSVMLALIPLVPWLTASRPRGWVRRAWTAAGVAVIVGAWFVFNRLLGALTKMPGAASVGAGIRRAGVLDRIIGELQQRLYAPDLERVVETATAHPLRVGALALIVGAVCGWLALRVRRDGWRALAAAPILLAAAVHQFGLAVLLLAAHLVLFARRWSDVATPVLRAVYAAATMCLVFWVWTLGFYRHADTMLLKWLVGYPHLFQYFFQWFVAGWPVFFAVYVGGSVYLAARVCAQREDLADAFLLGAVWVPVAATSFLENEFYAARFVFHVYPFMVLLMAWIVVQAAERLAAARNAARAIAAVVLGVSVFGLFEDAHPVAAWRIAERSYATAKDPVRGTNNWKWYASFHPDYKGPALFVKRQPSPGPIIAMGPPYKIAIDEFYAGRVEYSIEQRVKGYQRRQADGHVRDHITNSIVLSTPEQVRQAITDAPEGVWLLGDWPMLDPENYEYDEPIKALLRHLAQHVDCLGEDGKTFAVRVSRENLP